jgi:hypothetical protein
VTEAITRLRNTLIIGVVLAVGVALYAGNNGNGKDVLSRNERAIEIRFVASNGAGGKPIRFVISGRFGPAPFDRGGKGNGYIEAGVARVGDEVYANLWIEKDSPRGIAVCSIWQTGKEGTVNITESTAGPDGYRDFTCWAQVKR